MLSEHWSGRAEGPTQAFCLVDGSADADLGVRALSQVLLDDAVGLSSPVGVGAGQGGEVGWAWVGGVALP